MALEIELSANQRRALRRAIRNGDYHLLLGAGASLDSTGGDGRKLPNSTDLAQRIASRFSVPLEEGDLLWRVYARAMEDAEEESVYEWLRRSFWDVTPPHWMKAYARVPWARVWTLNIDDSFEQAYELVKTETSRETATINWDEEFRHGRDLYVIHLHGCVDRPSPPRRLIFSLSDYSDAAVSRAAWPLTFRDSYGVSPFVIVGARLRDEPDIEKIVASRKPIHDAPTFYVKPGISAGVKRDLLAWNIIPVEMTAEQFADNLAELTGMSLDEPPSQREEIAFRVGQQFRELRTDGKIRIPTGHDFIGGDEPDWRDIRAGLYADLDWIRQGSSYCRQLGQSIRPSSVLIYVGKRLTGRSAGLLAIGKTLRDLSWRTFLYVGDERLDVDAILQFAASDQDIALLFDSIIDIADDVSELIGLARGAGLKVFCVAADEVGQSAKLIERFKEAELVHRHIHEINFHLTRTDATHLVDKLLSIPRPGILEEWGDARRIAHFRHRELFDAMAQLENSPGFGRRVEELVSGISESIQVEILLIAALSSRFERKLHAVDAARMVGIESEAVVRMVKDTTQLGSVLKMDGLWIRPRHRWMALDACIARMGGPRDALSFLSSAINRLSFKLGKESLRERNATAMLVGSLMSHKWLTSIFPDVDLETWYESLSPTFGDWSARYWEQRAIMNRHKAKIYPDALARAESFALRAVTILRDSYSLTTLGTVLMAKAAHGGVDNVSDYYDRSIDSFEEASAEKPTNLVPWLAYLRSSLDVIQNLHSGSPQLADPDLWDRIVDDWARIHSDISTVAGVSKATKNELENLKRRYGDLILVPPSPQQPRA
ncbi:SIR2 family protein [Streptomyces xantholiticus]|uniref:SIR2 family protein n=1 Tax=Streptomyces xantholiticus TaxID=68285 RepID=A0ABV1UTN9_9ACTN